MSSYLSTSRTLRHWGQAAQTQKSLPALGPLLALRRSILLLQSGQERPDVLTSMEAHPESVVTVGAGSDGVTAVAFSWCGGGCGEGSGRPSFILAFGAAGASGNSDANCL